MFENEVIKDLLKKYKRLWALGHARALMGWDNEVNMPRGGSEERGVAIAEISTLSQEILLSPEFTSLVEKASKQEGLNDYEEGVVRVLNRDISIMKKIPPSLLYEISETSQKAFHAWRDAREKNDFSLFSKHLEKIVKLSIELAEKLGYEKEPYDALLDLFEEGLRTDDVINIFSYLKPSMKKIVDKVLSEKYYYFDSPLEKERYDVEKMKQVNKEVLDLLEFPWDRGRLDISPHPFTNGLGLNDVRITTRYEGFDFKRSLFSVVHEFGHATYELQIDQNFKMTPLASGVSLGIHESQSRFWENIIGRSKQFTELIKPILDKHLGFTRNYDAEDIYRYFALVKPSPIRTEADELTYNFHILLRFELERLMLRGEININDLPELWNDKMEEYLGIRPKSYKEGVLQDVHWSHADLGYFPTYTLGNIVAAQIREYLLRSNFNIYELVSERRIKDIKEKLKELIHKYGSTYRPKDLLRKQLGEEYNPKYIIDYFEEKYIGH
ncbi:MAG: carboxypeptidase M32 [Caldisphaeraceae archaeon]|nr:carboxypeptidase M32 [Caldisphaeraceae archaeon]MEB2793583.1 carboxypeptidase M32 [Caldisphaeraceae archaeon]MEB3692244.1 carboxypeptidase M32 [Caldisphaeraceae archaeon]MEB3797801.1 carboxypeptidase M32 [Caldisphaeraceae archaeon]